MSNESARRGSTGNAEHPVEAPCRRSCNGLQTSCKTRRAQGGPERTVEREADRCGWPATTLRRGDTCRSPVLRPSAHGVVDAPETGVFYRVTVVMSLP